MVRRPKASLALHMLSLRCLLHIQTLQSKLESGERLGHIDSDLSLRT